jgi:alkaline phosphatase D
MKNTRNGQPQGLILLFLLAFSSLFAQKTSNITLRSGPMLGYIEMLEALVWVQTTDAATVEMVYWDSAAIETKHFSNKILTEKKDAFTAKLIADEVEPGRTYFYEIRLDGRKIDRPYPTLFRTQPLWQYRTEPPVFSVAAGSCSYINEEKYDRPGKGYGSEYGIFNAIYEKKPNLMLWLGDNAYLREVDFYSQTGIFHRYSHSRALPEMQPLLASCAHLAIWDDHEYGPNDADRTYINKDKTRHAFERFWGNPTFGLDGQHGITSFYQYGDVDIFLCDDRYFRAPNDCTTCERTILGAEQRKWLCEALTSSRAPFKLVAVGGQFLNLAKKNETFSNLAPAERDTILNFIEKEKIKGVIFLTGDRHFSELSKWTGKNNSTVYDLTSSSLTAGSYKIPNEINALRVEGTMFDSHNFTTLTFSGPRKKRVCTIKLFDTNGKEIWARDILE